MGFRRSIVRGGVSYGRRLAFERLELRDLLAVMRIVDWNTLNGPNDAAGEANFQTILAAIGNETVQGNTKRLDILALQETDSPPDGDSIGRIESILDTLYPTTDYESAVSGRDGGGDYTGFVYDTATVSLLEAIQIAPESLTHTILRGKFRPSDTLGESDFYVYSIHLKSGDTLADETARGNEAAILRADADALGDGAHVLFVGDFNMKSSNESAWTTLVGAGPGQLRDVADAPGNWFNSESFKHLHTQDPRFRSTDVPPPPGEIPPPYPGTGMNDRFDLQFASGEFFDGVGLEYVGASFRVFGNNGTHNLGQSIATGSGASQEVLYALASASDHLPIVADYEIIVSTPGVRIIQTGGGTKVAESGFYDTYSIVLDTIPAANVTVTVQPDSQLDLGNGPGVAMDYFFTPANALTPQTVIVNAFDDTFDEANHVGSIMHTSVSADPEYDGLSIANLTVNILDDDLPALVINEVDSNQTGTDMAEFIELYDGGVGDVALDGFTVVFFTGSTDTAYRVIPLSAAHRTNANGYFVIGNPGVANVSSVTFPNNTLQNGADAVALYLGSFALNAPVTTANLVDAIVYDNSNADDAGLLVLLDHTGMTQPQVNEDAGGNGASNSMARVPDGGLPRKTQSYIVQPPTPGVTNQAQPVGVIITHSGTRVDIEEGGATDSYQISLQTIPTSDVTITVDPDNQSQLNGMGAGVPIVLTFTPADALIPKIVQVAAIDDLAVEGVHTSLITHAAASADPQYNGLSIPNVVANIVDDDAPPPITIVINEIDADTAGVDSLEFVELYDGGAGNVSLDGLIVVFYNGSTDTSYFSVDLDGMTTDANGFFVLGNAAVPGVDLEFANNTLQNGQDAVAIYNSPTPFPNGTSVTTAGLIDAIVYDTDDADDPGLLELLEPGQPQLNENENMLGTSQALARVPNGGAPRQTATYVAQSPTPGASNQMSLPGDYNSDGIVDAGDYVRWRNNLGDPTEADISFSGDGGDVTISDYAYWKARYGNPGGGSGGLAALETLETDTSNAAPDLAFGDFSWRHTASLVRPAAPSRPETAAPLFDAADLLLALAKPPDAADALDRAPSLPSRHEAEVLDSAFAALGDLGLLHELGQL